MSVSIANSFLVLALALVAGDARSAKAPAPPDAPQQATYPFTFETLLEDAKRRAATPYSPQRNRVPRVSTN